MRRLADELDVGTMTLYGYVHDKADLFEAMVDAGAAELVIPEASGSWRHQLGQLMRELRRVLLAHPNLTRLRFARPIVSPGAFRFTEAALGILEDAGFDRAEAARALRSLFVLAFGYATFNAEEAAEETRREVRAALSRLPEKDYPALNAARDELVDTLSGEVQFDYGLERLLDGLEVRLRGSARR